MFDTLILLWNCSECTQLKMNFDFSKAFADQPVGKNGATLLVYYTFSNSGLKELLNKIGIDNISSAPLLQTSSGEIVRDLPKMIEYMKANY